MHLLVLMGQKVFNSAGQKKIQKIDLFQKWFSLVLLNMQNCFLNVWKALQMFFIILFRAKFRNCSELARPLRFLFFKKIQIDLTRVYSNMGFVRYH